MRTCKRCSTTPQPSRSYGSSTASLKTQGVTPAGLALGWLLNHPVVTASIVSVSKESQWQGIHDALTLKWTGTVGELLDEVFGR